MLSGRTNINNPFARNYMNGRVEVKSQKKLRSGILYNLRSKLLAGWMMGFEPTTLRTTI